MLKWFGIAAGVAILAFLGYCAFDVLSATMPPITTNDGPAGDVEQVNALQRASFGKEGYEELFTVADGDYAVNASNLGEGWRTRAFRRTSGAWRSLHLFVNLDPCSLAKAGFPTEIALRVSRKFKGRMLDHSGEPDGCFTDPESVTTDEGPAPAIAAIRTLARADDRGSCCQFSVVDGDYAVSAALDGGGYDESLYRKIGAKWASLHLGVYTNACSLRRGGVPPAVANRLDRDFRTRNLYDAGDPGSCRTMPKRTVRP